MGDEFRAAVGCDMTWDAMFGEDVENEQFGESCCGKFVVGRDEYALFCEAVDDDEDCGMSCGRGKLFYEVHRDRIPRERRDW